MSLPIFGKALQVFCSDVVFLSNGESLAFILFLLILLKIRWRCRALQIHIYGVQKIVRLNVCLRTRRKPRNFMFHKSIRGVLVLHFVLGFTRHKTRYILMY